MFLQSLTKLSRRIVDTCRKDGNALAPSSRTRSGYYGIRFKHDNPSLIQCVRKRISYRQSARTSSNETSFSCLSRRTYRRRLQSLLENFLQATPSSSAINGASHTCNGRWLTGSCDRHPSSDSTPIPCGRLYSPQRNTITGCRAAFRSCDQEPRHPHHISFFIPQTEKAYTASL